MKGISQTERLREQELNRGDPATLLQNMWLTMSRRPDVWNKLQGEVAILDGQKPSFEQLKNLKYLQAIMNEVLRLWPPAPLHGRIAVRDTILPRGGGPDGSSPLFVPKDMKISWNL